MNSVSVQDLVVTKSHYPAIAQSTFELPGRFCALVIGANGSGKTTLLKALSGTTSPTRGIVRVTSPDATSDNTRELRRYVSYVGHTPLFMRHITVHEHLDLCTKLGVYSDEKFVLTAIEAMEACHLTHRKNVRIDQLSAGQQRRLHFASALVRSPHTLCVDEPHASLDSESKDLIDSLFASQYSLGRNFVIATHDPDRLKDIATHTINVENGCATLESAP
jgi:ABC-type multidrug transport system ATPase subunit